MYVKAISEGMYDLAKNGAYVQIKEGTVFEVPDTLRIGPKSWVVRCDRHGNVTDVNVARKAAEDARTRATKEAGEAKIAAAKAAKEAKDAELAEKRAKELEDAAAKEAADAAKGNGDPAKT